MFTNIEKQQIKAHGLDVKEVEHQLNFYENGVQPIKLALAATVDHGIIQFADEDIDHYINIYEKSLRSGLKAVKFVPASGSASRMFKYLFDFIEDKVDETDPDIKTFIENISSFAFYDELVALPQASLSMDNKSLIKLLMGADGLNYGMLPKGLIKFYKYKDASRTAFEEHLVESASYCLASDGMVLLHFTVSPQHQEKFEDLLGKVLSDYEKKFKAKFNIRFSQQKKSTDSVAVTLDNDFFIDDEKMLFRPSGHGALIENLGDIDADLIFIKNIDNVVPDWQKNKTIVYKKALAGYLLNIRSRVFGYLEKLENKSNHNDEYLIDVIENFIRKDLSHRFKTYFASNKEKVKFLKEMLNRPIRVCGMVENTGEPGGGPFWVINKDATVSLQIVEKAQINFDDPFQAELVEQSTHFNPVDIVCSTKNFKGESFDLNDYIDEDAGFISHKYHKGRELKCIERPGLWNGAMSNWITLFVEVPPQTFNPVKSVNDLLRAIK